MKNPLEKIREGAIATIRSILNLANTESIETAELSAGKRPIIHTGLTQKTNYTLSKITAYGNGDIIIESSCEKSYRNDFHADLGTFTLEKIADFLKENKETILDISNPTFSKEQRELIAETIDKAFLNIFSDNYTRTAAIEQVLPHVLEHIATNADWSSLGKNEIVVGDVSIALEAVMRDFLYI